MQTNFFTKRVDNALLIFFRMAFGFLLAFHAFKHITSGDVFKLYLKPKYLFPFIDFEWLKPLPGYGMYWYFALMGIAGIFVSIGFMYRYSLAVLTVLFSGTYFMQKIIYNNHHYLVILLCLFLLIMPTNRFASVDVRRNPSIKQYSMPQWCRLAFIFQVSLVYIFAAVAKMYPTWLDGTFTSILMQGHRRPTYLFITQNHYFHLFLAWGGLLFDLLIVPIMLYKRTRVLGAVAMVFFHLFNWYTLTIGIFPFLALSLMVFFYPPDVIRERMFWIKKEIPETELDQPQPFYEKWIVYLLVPYAIIQLLLPLRHFVIDGNLHYTEEGHRLSWRMKLHQKRVTYFAMYAKEKGNNKTDTIPLKEYFTKAQISRFTARPDMIWQAAQYIKKEYAKKGKDISIYCSSRVSFNKLPERQILDTTVDLTSVKWDMWRHSAWVLKNDE